MTVHAPSHTLPRRTRPGAWPRPVFFLAAADAAVTLLLGILLIALARESDVGQPDHSGPLFGRVGVLLGYAAGGLIGALAILYAVLAAAVWRPQRAPTVILAVFGFLQGGIQALACLDPKLLGNPVGQVFAAQTALLLATAVVATVTAFLPDAPAPPLADVRYSGTVAGGYAGNRGGAPGSA